MYFLKTNTVYHPLLYNIIFLSGFSLRLSQNCTEKSVLTCTHKKKPFVSHFLSPDTLEIKYILPPREDILERESSSISNYIGITGKLKMFVESLLVYYIQISGEKEDFIFYLIFSYLYMHLLSKHLLMLTLMPVILPDEQISIPAFER